MRQIWNGFITVALFFRLFHYLCNFRTDLFSVVPPVQVDPKKSFPRPKLIDGQTKVSRSVTTRVFAEAKLIYSVGY